MSTSSNEVLQTAQETIQRILKEKVEDLHSLILVNKQNTQELMDLRVQQNHLEQIAEEQEGQLEQLRPNVQALKIEVTSLEKQKVDLVGQIHNYEKNKVDTLQHVESQQHTLVQHEDELKELNQTADDLNVEIQKRAREVQILQERIEGMQRLRDEHMLSIMNLTHELSNISSGARDDKGE